VGGGEDALERDLRLLGDVADAFGRSFDASTRFRDT